MQKGIKMLMVALLLLSLVSCTSMSSRRYNTQKGAAIGAGLGALTGQALGHDTGSTLIGAGVGTLMGAIVGNAIDQSHQAAIDNSGTNHQYYAYPPQVTPSAGYRPYPSYSANSKPCRMVTERIWEDGRLIRETSREVCGRARPRHAY